MLMKKIAITLSVATMLAFAACGDNADKEGKGPGQNPGDEPVMNSGP